MNYPKDPFMAGNIKLIQAKRLNYIEWLGKELNDVDKATKFVDELLKLAIDETNNYHRRMASVMAIESRYIVDGYLQDEHYTDEDEKVSND